MFVSYFGIIIWWFESFITTSIFLIVTIVFFIVANYLVIRYSFIKI